MDLESLDRLLSQALLLDIHHGLEDIYERLADLYEGWQRMRADEEAIAYLGQILAELEWWSGRASAAATLQRPVSDEP